MKDFIKKYYKNFIIVFILGFGVYFYILSKHDAKNIINTIKGIEFHYLIIMVLLFIFYLFIEGIVLHLFTTFKVNGVKFLDSFRLNLSTQFFNNITPFAMGGQPFQIFYLSKRGLKVEDSSSIVMMNYITYVIAFDIVGLVSLIWKYQFFNELLNGKGYLMIIGFGVNIFMTVLVFFLAYSRRFYHIIMEVIWMKIIYWPFLKRFKLHKKTDSINQTIDNFNREIKELNNHKKLWFISVSLHILRIAVVYSIPVVLFISLNVPMKGQLVNFLIGGFFVAMIMSYIPSPGGSGGAEYFYRLFFKGLLLYVGVKEIVVIDGENVNVIDNMIFSSMMLWRFVTYYLFIILGFIALITLNFKKTLDEVNYEEEDLDYEIEGILQKEI